jgi:7,8-dihydropterin-6-yl-methyl-4-(beta-D-ribofuranosyl)aminobenzene 5'-phosphate synthase
MIKTKCQPFDIRTTIPMTTPPRMTILFDNYPGNPGLTNLWGFAVWIRSAGRTILFDTGSNGRVLLRNMAALGLAPESIDLIFLSHPHWDHMGGLDSVLELNPDVTVVVHEGFSKHLIHDLRTLCADLVVIGADPHQLAPGIFSTGMLGSQPSEHAMLIQTNNVTVAVSGCAHPGMERIVEHAKSFLGEKIDWAVGGFHLMHAEIAEIEQSVRSLQDLGVAYVLPTHCIGNAAMDAFRRSYGEKCIHGGVGREVAIVQS